MSFGNNQTTKLFVYRWQCAHAAFDVTCFPAFVVALDVISTVLSTAQQTGREASLIFVAPEVVPKFNECELTEIKWSLIKTNESNVQVVLD